MTFGGVHIRMGDDGEKSYQDAAQNCTSLGGYLPKITSNEELLALKQIMGIT